MRLVLSSPILAAGLSALAAAPIAARGDGGGAPPFDVAGIAQNAFGVQTVDGALVAAGPDYKASFDGGAFRFTPAFGPAAERNTPLELRLEWIERGGERVLVAGGAQAALAGDGRTVVFDRGLGVTERYAARRDGVEESVVLARPLGAAGDLVVHLSLACELPGRALADGGLRFDLDGVGAITYGAVTGIDALGRTAPGDARLANGGLELVLPATFVDGAAYPLVLDPLVGTDFNLSSIANDDFDPDVAYDESSGVYLVTWTREISALDWDIRGQRVSTSGALVGSILALDSTSAISFGSAVANVNSSNRFGVAWSEASGATAYVVCRTVVASSGAASAKLTLTSSSASQYEVDACGEATLADDDFLVVWNDSANGLYGRQVSAPTSSDPFVVSSFTLSTNYDDSAPAIAKSLGEDGRALVVWQRWYDGADHDLRRAIVDRNGVILVSDGALLTTIGPDEENPDVDGDGTSWVVVYQREEVTGAGDNDLYAMSVRYAASGVVVSSSVEIEGDSSDDEINPAVGWADNAAVVSYLDFVSALDYDLYVKTIDPFTLAILEPEMLIASHLRSQHTTDVATKVSAIAGSPQDAGDHEAMIAFGYLDTVGALGEVCAVQRFASQSGVVVERAASCGDGGRAYATGARAGNTAFTHRLVDAAVGDDAYLVIGFEPIDVACGACTLYPNPFSGFAFWAGTTDSFGSASIATTIPNDASVVGLTFLDQWAVVPGASACSNLGADLSNALQVQIQ